MISILYLVIFILAVVAIIHIVHAATLDRRLQYKEVSFVSAKLPPGLDGYRIAFVTDTHRVPKKRLLELVNKLDKSSADLLVLGGDFISKNEKKLDFCVEMLAKIKTVDGIYGVDGNHDTQEELFKKFTEHNITPLPNTGARVRENLFVCGVTNHQNSPPDISAAVDGAGDKDFVLLLAHSPDITMHQDTAGVDLILSGHTHGGHITFFGKWAPALANTRHITSFGQRFMSGFAASHSGVPVFVSNGVGEDFPRVFAKPEVVIITLRANTRKGLKKPDL